MGKSKTKAEKLYMSKVAMIGCIVCYNNGIMDTPAELHHVRNGQGMGQRASHFDILPLCHTHHRTGNNGVAFHAGKESFEFNFGSEVELLEQVKGMINAS